MRFRTLNIPAALALSAMAASAGLAQLASPTATPPAKVVLLGRAPVAKETLKVRFPRPKKYMLPNGLRVLVLEDHKLPTISMTLSLTAGSFFDPAGKEGVATLTADMLDEGTSSRTSEQIASIADSLGASIGAGAEQGGERASVSVSGLSDDTKTLINLFADVILNPTFPDDQFAKVKRQEITGLSQAAKQPALLAEVAARQAIYGQTAPSQVLPSIAQVNAVTTADLKAFHIAYYRPERAILAIAGDVNADDIFRRVSALFAQWPRGAEPVEAALPSYTPQGATKVFVVDRPGSVQTAFEISNLGIDRKNADFPALTVMNRILGGGSSISSRLGQNIREAKGYTYDVRSSFDTPRYPGLWSATTQVRSAVTAPTLKELFYEFGRIQDEPVTDRELDSAKRGIVGGFARRLESPDAVLGLALEIEEFGLPADYWDKYPAQIQAITKADVQRVAKQYIGTGRVQIVAVGERAKIEDALKTYGAPTVLDLNVGA